MNRNVKIDKPVGATGRSPATMSGNPPVVPQRKLIRLREYDYSSAGAYFVTLCVQNRECLFGKIHVGQGTGAYPELYLNDAGQMVINVWQQIPDHYSGIEIDEFIVMPNHFHGIIIIGAEEIVGAGPRARPPDGQPQGVAPTSLGHIVSKFKTLTTKRYIDGVKQKGWPPFQGKVWQRNYYEHVIRDEDDMNDTREYIHYNVAKWELDKEYHP